MRSASVRQPVLYVLLCAAAIAFSFSGSRSAAAADQPAEAGHAADSSDEHAPEGVPLGFKRDLAFWSLVTFLVFIFVLKKFAWRPLAEGLDKRESRIRESIAKAEAANMKSEKLLAEHEARLAATQDEAREIIAEARRDAERTKQDIVTAAQQEADATRERAIGEIERATEVALKEIFDTMSSQVAGATEHVLGRALSDNDRARLIDDALAQMAPPN